MNADPDQLELEILPELAVGSDVVVVLVGSMEEAARVVDVYSAGENHGTIRYYDPVLGRFVARDPMKYIDGMSMYCGYFVPGMTDSYGLGPPPGEGVPEEEGDDPEPHRKPGTSNVEELARERAEQARRELLSSEELRDLKDREALEAREDLERQDAREAERRAGLTKAQKAAEDAAKDARPCPKMERNTAQDKLLSKGEIKKLKDAGIDPHDLKGGVNASKQDLYKDKEGNIYVKPKGGDGPGEPTNINIHLLE